MLVSFVLSVLSPLIPPLLAAFAAMLSLFSESI
jgi:hypothetical protein